MIDRHQSEVRHVLRLRVIDKQRAEGYIKQVRKARGDAAANRLNADCVEQWSLGNRGEKGDWR